MTVDTLKDCNKKFLAQMAKDQGIVGLARDAQGSIDPSIVRGADGSEERLGQGRGSEQRSKTVSSVPKRATPAPATAGSGIASSRRAEQSTPIAPPSKPIAVFPPRALEHACVKDRIIAMVRDPYWLHAYWELSRSTYARARPPSARSGIPPGRCSG